MMTFFIYMPCFCGIQDIIIFKQHRTRQKSRLKSTNCKYICHQKTSLLKDKIKKDIEVSLILLQLQAHKLWKNNVKMYCFSYLNANHWLVMQQRLLKLTYQSISVEKKNNEMFFSNQRSHWVKLTQKRFDLTQQWLKQASFWVHL